MFKQRHPATTGTVGTSAHIVGAAAIILGASLATAPAHATNGYFSNGFGVASKAMAGAGVAGHMDMAFGDGAIASAANPALGVDVGNAITGCVSGFAPDRDLHITGSGGLTAGSYESGNKFFLIPCAGINKMWSNDTAVGLLMYANGGMNTRWDTNVFAGFNGTASESTPLSSDIAQVFFQGNVAHNLGNGLKVGGAPVLAIQRAEFQGLEPFTGSSTDGENVTNRGYDYSYGGGAKFGATYEPVNWLTVGASYTTRMWMTKWDKYKGLLAEQGDFDVPPTAAFGLTVKPMNALAVHAEVQRIWYGDVASVSNTHVVSAFNLGSDNGAGFGWNDMDIGRLAAEYQVNPDLIVRAGWSHTFSEFIEDNETMFNILAPATVRDHASLGFTYNMTPAWALSGAFTHAFAHSVNGTNNVANGNPGNQYTKLRMSQNEATIGASYKF